MNRYADHGRAQNAAMKNVTGLKDLQNRTVFVLDRFGAIHRLMRMRIKLFAERVDALDAEARDVVHELLIDELEAFAIIFVFGFAMRGERVLKTVDNGDQAFDYTRCVALGVV